MKNAPISMSMVGVVQDDMTVAMSATPATIQKPDMTTATTRFGTSSNAASASEKTVIVKNNLTWCV